MYKNIILKHNMLGDIMFYFFMKVIFNLLIVMVSYYLLNKKEINILEILVLLFIFHINIMSIYNNVHILVTLFFDLIIMIFYYLYQFLYNKNISKKIIDDDNVLIDRGIINFNNLIKYHISYQGLIESLRKYGINNPSFVDYCIKKNNNLIVFKKNSIKNYPISIIIDGKIIKDNLFSINKTIDWLNKQINDNNLELKNINYAYFKNKEIYFITN